MYRHFSARLLRFDRSVSDARRGFTLVELLVVIAIIAMLVGLLIPAVNRAREAGRRAQCLNNQQQIGKAMVNYVTEKNKFPPLFTLQPDPSGYNPNPLAVGWVPTMLPLLEQNPLYQVYQNNNWIASNILSAEVSTLICPSRNPTYSPAPLSYIVNAGMSDVYKSTMPPPPLALDYRENGIFFDNFAWQAGLPSPIPPKPPVVDLAYLNKHGGNSMTLMFSENLDARDWIQLSNTSAENQPIQPMYNNGLPVESWWQSLTWYVIKPKPATASNWGLDDAPTGTLLNKNVGTGAAIDQNWGRPSSSHPGGFIVTMCDGHSQFMDEGIQYRVYCLLAAPDSANAKWPSDGTLVEYPDRWRSPPGTGMLTPVTAADIE